MAHVDTPWTRLASRTARGLLARKGATYESLAQALCAMGVPESVRGAESKIQRGSFRFSFFIQILKALDSEYPTQWEPYLETDDTWEIAAARIFRHELDAGDIDIHTFAVRLSEMDISIEAETLQSLVSIGEFPFSLVLQLSSIAPVSQLCRFVDQRDIERTAGGC